MNDVVFIPVGINYDWVIEDTTLIKEWKKRKEKSRISDHFFSLMKIVGKGPLVLIINIFRYMTGNLKNHGYASVSFGDPVSISDFLKKQKQDIFKLDRRERLAIVKEFADTLLARIGKVVPVTPLCLTAMAIYLLKETNRWIHRVSCRQHPDHSTSSGWSFLRSPVQLLNLFSYTHGMLQWHDRQPP